MKDKEKKLSLIRDYIKENIGGFEEDVFASSVDFEYNRFECSMMIIKVSLEECNVQVEVFKTHDNIKLVLDFKDWYAEHIAKSECKYIKKSYFGNIECIRWDYIEKDDENVWEDTIKVLSDSGMFHSLIKGCVQSIHGDTMYPTLRSDTDTFMVIFDGENHITIWGISACSFEDAWEKVRSIVYTAKDTRHFKKYNYCFVNCMGGYNIEVSFTM